MTINSELSLRTIPHTLSVQNHRIASFWLFLTHSLKTEAIASIFRNYFKLLPITRIALIA